MMHWTSHSRSSSNFARDGTAMRAIDARAAARMMSSLSSKWWYSDAAVTPSSLATRRTLTAATPSSLTMRNTTSTTWLRVISGWRGRATVRPSSRSGGGYLPNVFGEFECVAERVVEGPALLRHVEVFDGEQAVVLDRSELGEYRREVDVAVLGVELAAVASRLPKLDVGSVRQEGDGITAPTGHMAGVHHQSQVGHICERSPNGLVATKS